MWWRRCTWFVGKAWARKSEPFVWHEDPAKPFFKPAATGWDSRSLRLDFVLSIPEQDAYSIDYSATDRDDAQDRFGLAICPAGEDGSSGVTPETIRRSGAEPVLAPEPAEPFCETMASQSAVFRERDATGQWRCSMNYSYRGGNGVLPEIRLATSRDCKSWERHSNAEDPTGKGHLFASTPDACFTDRWYLYTQACPLPANRNDIDGKWDL